MDFKIHLMPKKSSKTRRKGTGVAEETENGHEREKTTTSCIIHFKIYDAENNVRNFTGNSWLRVKEANLIRKNELLSTIATEFSKEEVPDLQYGYHPKCYSKFTHKKSLQILEKAENARKILADHECCICRKRKTAKNGSGYERLEKCETENAAKSLKEAAIKHKDNSSLLVELVSVDWEVIVAKEYFYHRTCYRNYTYAERESAPVENNSFQSLLQYIKEQVIDSGKVINMNEILSKDEMFQSEEPSTSKTSIITDSRTLSSKIAKSLGTKIEFWLPRRGSLFIFSNEVPKGQVIEVSQPALKKAAISKKNDNDSTEKIKKVAKFLRDEIKKSNDTLQQWPPSEDDLLSSETELPFNLVTFLKALLSEGGNITGRKKKRIESIGKDIIYCVKNGRDRTDKHVLLSLCVKRKTGSKEIVNWLNKLGHCISYDEVRYLETTLAVQQTKYKALKTFVPAVIQPERFLTFVWDNNDINPETLTGINMHCTNGIMVQLAQPEDEIVHQPVSPVTKKARSYRALQTDLDPVCNNKRVNPDSIPYQMQPIQECEIISKYTDFLWSLLKQQAAAQELHYSIPNWTGFNALISEEIPTFHRIPYLPAIDALPTKLEIVLELLQQSKIKAELLGLQETDIVLDQAVYAKAFELLQMPRHQSLKDFVVLRLGAFHTTCTFLAIIGKRFGDAGLRDIIVEADLLGQSSVEEALNGKHYNNSLRVLKYVFDALNRLKRESFANWLEGSENQGTVETLTSMTSFSTALHDITKENFDSLLANSDWFKKLFLKYEEHLSGTLSVKIEQCYRNVTVNSLKITTLLFFQICCLGNFAVRRQPGCFNVIPSDQCIEQTINRGQKCHGGITGYSTSVGTVQRWMLTSHCAANAVYKLESMLSIGDEASLTKDIGAARMKFDEESVARTYEVVKSWGSPFTISEHITNLSSGLVAPQEVQNDFIRAHEKGESAMMDFINERVATSARPFYDPIARLKLKTFASMKAKKVCKLKEKITTMNVERGLFAKLLIIAEKRNTSKLLDALEADVPLLEVVPPETVFIFDGMALLQQVASIPLDTFGDVSDQIFNRVMKGNSDTVYFVTDQYLEHSIKEIERRRRTTSGTIQIKQERRSQKTPKQFKRYLNDPKNKIDLVKFLMVDWSSTEKFRSKLDT
eukprot:gene21054-23110_t